MNKLYIYYFVILIWAFIISDDREIIHNLEMDLAYVCQDLDRIQDISLHKVCDKIEFPRSR